MTQEELAKLASSIKPGRCQNDFFAKHQAAIRKAQSSLVSDVDPIVMHACGIDESESEIVDIEGDPVDAMNLDALKICKLGPGSDRALEHFRNHLAGEVRDPEGNGCGCGCFTTDTAAAPVTRANTDPIVKAILAKLLDPAEQAFERSRADVALPINTGVVHKSAPLEKSHQHVSITQERVAAPLRIAHKMGASEDQMQAIAELFAKNIHDERQAVLAEIRGEEFEPEEVAAE